MCWQKGKSVTCRIPLSCRWSRWGERLSGLCPSPFPSRAENNVGPGKAGNSSRISNVQHCAGLLDVEAVGKTAVPCPSLALVLERLRDAKALPYTHSDEGGQPSPVMNPLLKVCIVYPLGEGLW